MYDRDSGAYKFTLFYYIQQRAGIPVFRAELRLLVANRAGSPLVWAASTLRDLGNFQPPIPPGFDPARQAATGLERFGPPEPVIWAGVGDLTAPPILAFQFIGEAGSLRTRDYQKWLIVADALTGTVLYRENLILTEDVTGSVSGLATIGPKAEQCAEELPAPIAECEVSLVDGPTVYTDPLGNFVIPDVGGGPVTLEARLHGRRFDVYNWLTDDTVLTLTVVPPGPAALVFNEANEEYTRAEVNAYVQANLVRSFVLSYQPQYPVIAGQVNFPVNVNRTDGFCPGNAWYDLNSLNFCAAGTAGGFNFPNTAYSGIVHHEYGHHLVQVDSIAVLIADDPVGAYGFFGDCDSGLRTAANDYQYPCRGEVHDCGQLLSGCIWSTRNELAASHPDSYRDILAELTINSILLHVGDQITPQIATDFLTLDDDDGDLTNGTPHYFEICRGFGSHNVDCPFDCNGNGIFDALDLAAGTSPDCNANGVPDECDLPDCNHNHVPDECDIAAGTSPDCNGNNVPDECLDIEADCNQNGWPDECDIAAGASPDCDANGRPDECPVPSPYGWTHTVGGPGSDYVSKALSDNEGNLFVVGVFEGTVDFNPGSGDVRVSSGYSDIFVTKLLPDASYAWTLTIGGTGRDVANSAAIDPNGDLLLVGYFYYTVDFDPGPGQDLHTSHGGWDIFVTKLHGDGSYGWTRTIGGGSGDSANNVATDAAGNVYVVGAYVGTVDFDPGPDVDQHTAVGGSDIFLLRLGPDGSHGWSCSLGGTLNDFGRGVAVATEGDLVVVGQFSQTVDFDPGAGEDPRTSNGYFDAFVQRLHPDGSYAWTNTVGGTGNDAAYAVAVGPTGQIYVAGNFQRTVDFDPGPGQDLHTSLGGDDIFISRLAADGGHAWTRTFGGLGWDDVSEVAVLADGSALLTGCFEDLVDFDPGPGVDEYASVGLTDAFLTLLRPDGSYGWTYAIGGAKYDGGNSVAVQLGGPPPHPLLLAGYFRETVDFNPADPVDARTSQGAYDGFLTRFAWGVFYGDCDQNGVWDGCDIASGAADANANGLPDTCELLPGDLNCDGTVSTADINPFVILLTRPAWWQASYPGCLMSNGDINGDGSVDFRDINPFVSLIAGGR